jgi:hypothetical protein
MKNGIINYGNVAVVFLMVIAGAAIAYSDSAHRRSDVSNNINYIGAVTSSLVPHSQLESTMPQTEWNSTYNSIDLVSGSMSVIQISMIVLLTVFIAIGMFYMRSMA